MDSLQIVITELELEKEKLLKIKEEKQEKQKEVIAKILKINNKINNLNAQKNVLQISCEMKEKTLSMSARIKPQHFMFSLFNQNPNELLTNRYENSIQKDRTGIKTCSKLIKKEETKKNHYIEVLADVQVTINHIDERVLDIDSEIKNKLDPPEKQLILLPKIGETNE